MLEKKVMVILKKWMSRRKRYNCKYRAAGSSPASGPIIAFFVTAPGKVQWMYKNSTRNFHLQIPSTISYIDWDARNPDIYPYIDKKDSIAEHILWQFIIWQASLPVKWRTAIGWEALSAVHYLPVMDRRSIT
jgi:hypothetical protein